MKKHYVMALGVAVVAMTSACTSPAQYRHNSPDPIGVRLAQSADIIAKAQNDRADVAAYKLQMKTGKVLPAIDTKFIPEVERVVSLGHDYDGPLDKLIVFLSKEAGLKSPKFIGVKPPGDVMVHVRTDYRRIVDIMHDAATQAHGTKVVLKAKSKKVVVEYVPY